MEFFIFYVIVSVLAIHYIADFIFQTHEQAVNKSKSFYYLTEHSVVYGIVSAILYVPFLSWGIFERTIWTDLFPFYLIISHGIVDYFTSKWSSRYFFRQDYHMGFVVVGLDQLIHFVSIFAYLLLILN